MNAGPPEGTKFNWTHSQEKAIHAAAGNLIVSASAGSGKTAVLAERALRIVSELVADTGRPAATLDELLVITFTEKAARQMRTRIERRLVEEFEQQRGNSWLVDAIDRLPSVWIMTIDAFCRRLVVEHFHRAELSPAARIPDQAELAQLEQRVIEETLEQRAGEEGSRRRDIQALIGGLRRGVRDLVQEIRDLIRFLESLDGPERWLADVRRDMESTLEATRYDDLPEARRAAEAFADCTADLTEALGEIIDLAHAAHGPSDPLDNWQRLASDLQAMAEAPAPFKPDGLRAALEADHDPQLGKIDLKKVCGAAMYDDKSFLKLFLKPFRSRYASWREQWFKLDEVARLRGAKLAAEQGTRLLDLAEAARARIAREKRRRGWATFSDYERLALQVLTDPAGGQGPSEIAADYQARFKFVFVDEYQDTSPLQDALIRRVSRAEDPSPNVEGNLFMVGDYKQSIYRFRHAEPALFLEKLRAAEDTSQAIIKPIRRINLQENFRSRASLLEFINVCFERLMDEQVGQLNYGPTEALAPGRNDQAPRDAVGVEVCWMPKDAAHASSGDQAERLTADDGDVEELSGVEAQATWVARRIRQLTDARHGLQVPNPDAPAGSAQAFRPARPADCAILLRSIRRELDIWLKALEREGLKVRTPGIHPLFTAPELIDLISALRVVDNPLQDIPLAALLRSPMFGFSDDELLRIRMQRRAGPYWEAVWAAAGRSLGDDESSQSETETESPSITGELRGRLDAFLDRLDRWRTLAFSRPAVEVLDALVRDTDYEAWLIGKPDGKTRLEHLDTLRDLMRRLARPDDGANPLAAFLETVDRVQQETGELGDLPESLDPQNDAVNLLTIHKSKGLEFPIVILPRLERPFNRDRADGTRFDRAHGFALNGIDPDARRQYATLARQCLATTLSRQDRSEELRLLYVALTRACERLILVGQVGKTKLDHGEGDAKDKWRTALEERWARIHLTGGQRPPALDRLHAASRADLIGPIVEWLRRDGMRGKGPPPWLRVEFDAELPSVAPPDDWSLVRRALARQGEYPARDWEAALKRLRESSTGEGRDTAPDARTQPPESIRLLPAHDPARALVSLPAKMTVTQLRRIGSADAREKAYLEAARMSDELEAARFLEQEMMVPLYGKAGSATSRRPTWSNQAVEARETLEGATRGTLTHEVLARIDPRGALDAEGLRDQAKRLLDRGLLGGLEGASEAGLDQLDFKAMAWFFTTELGQDIQRRPGAVLRELPFTASKSVQDFDDAAWRVSPSERVLVQGVIDGVIDEGERATVFDYKTDRVGSEERLRELVRQYEVQIQQYAGSLRAIWSLRSVRAALIFLDARRVHWLQTD